MSRFLFSGRLLASTVLSAMLVSCAKPDAAKSDSTVVLQKRSDTPTVKSPGAAPTKVATIEGMKTPESVRYDPDQDVYFVSNINGNPNQKDNNGYIAKIDANNPTAATMFIEGGKNGVTLNAPKGMALYGDTLWVADIDAVRGFDRKTGKPVTTIDLSSLKVIFANDITVGPDGLYITDTGIHFDAKGAMTHPGMDQIIRIQNHKGTVVLSGDALKSAGGPNGITWDAQESRMLIGGFSGKDLVSWKPGDATVTTVATGAGGYDGLEVLPDRRIAITSWTDSTVNIVDGNKLTRYITGVDAPADIGFDMKRTRIAIPRFNANTVEIWDVKK